MGFVVRRWIQCSAGSRRTPATRPVVGDLRGGLEARAVGRANALWPCRRVAVLGVVDVLHRPGRGRLADFGRQRDIRRLVGPAPLLAVAGTPRAARSRSPSRVAHRQLGCPRAQPAAVTQQVGPRLGRSRYPSVSAMSSLQPSERTPIITSRHSLVLLQPHLHVHTIDPQVDEVHATTGRGPRRRAGLVLPLRRQPGHRRRRQSGRRCQGTAPAPATKSQTTIRADTAAAARRRSSATCAPTAPRSSRRTAGARRWPHQHVCRSRAAPSPSPPPAAVTTVRSSWHPLRTTKRCPSSSTLSRQQARYRPRPQPPARPTASDGHHPEPSHPSGRRYRRPPLLRSPRTDFREHRRTFPTSVGALALAQGPLSGHREGTSSEAWR